MTVSEKFKETFFRRNRSQRVIDTPSRGWLQVPAVPGHEMCHVHVTAAAEAAAGHACGS